MQNLEIVFCNPDDRDMVFSIQWKVLEHEVASIWFLLLLECLKSDKVFFQRFTGFIGGKKDDKFLLSGLQECIDCINLDGRYFIKEKALEFNQNFSNAIHHHFEILSGEFENPTQFIKDSNPEVTAAVAGLNYHIHDLEAYFRNLESGNVSFSGVILEIRECSRFILNEKFNSLFTMDIDFGDLVLHYSQIGKTWIETFLDRDEAIFPEAIRPHYALSGEFDILFGNQKPDENFLNALQDFLKKYNKEITDSSLKLGHLPIAKMIRDEQLTDINYKEKLSVHCEIKKIGLVDSDDVIFSKTF